MAWEHLSITRPHLVYIILGGFTSLFMLCSSIIKERLYIGEATVATLCGIIFGPHAANLINPLEWGNTDLITLEFSRIVLVVQCFAVGVELPKSYMERHWKSVTLLLVPVMTWGWLITSLFIWWMFGRNLNWLDSLCIAACVTATDPVLASSVVGKGKFAKRVPKHLRDLLSAESGCNDGMAFPFIYLAIYIIRYHHHPNKVAFHWFCFTILYECIFGAVYGVLVGYLARRAIRFAHEKDLIDRESFLVFYFVLALFCAGSGSLLGMDDLLVGFACGVGFSNDGWFQEKTEESHVSNVIDLLINLAFFVYFGTIVPWEQFNSSVLGISPWRLVVVGILVLLFRRIPIMLILKPVIPDIKTWREALFAGHFGPIGVGAIFVAILARAELETEETTPLAVIPPPGTENLNIIQLIWPITTFLVIVSIVIHGSSIAVFTLGRHINTLAISVSFTKANEEGPSWMERLPRIQSRSKSSASVGRPGDTDSISYDEKLEEGLLTPGAIPKGFLRRMKDDELPSRPTSAKSSKRRKRWDGHGPGGPVSSSAIMPAPRAMRPESDNLVMETPDEERSFDERKHEEGQDDEPEEEIYREGDTDIIEDEEGNVLDVRKSKKGERDEERNRHVNEEARSAMEEHEVKHGVAQDQHDHEKSSPSEEVVERSEETKDVPATTPTWRERISGLGGLRKKEESPKQEKKKHGPALAYQFGNTIIVEDEDGEVIKKYDIPKQGAESGRPAASDRRQSLFGDEGRKQLQRMGTWIGMGGREQHATDSAEAGPSDDGEKAKKQHTGDNEDEDEDELIRFTVGGAGGRRLSKADFIQTVQRLDPKSRQRVIDDSDAPDAIKREIASAATSADGSPGRANRSRVRPEVQRVPTAEHRSRGPEGLTLVDSNNEDIPFHSVTDTLAAFTMGQGSGETAAQRRRRRAVEHSMEEEEAHDPRRQRAATGRPRNTLGQSITPDERPSAGRSESTVDDGETAAERRRRLAALEGGDESSEDEDNPAAGSTGGKGFRDPTAAKKSPASRIAFAEPSVTSPAQARTLPAQSPSAGSTPHRSHGLRLKWGANVGKKPGE